MNLISIMLALVIGGMRQGAVDAMGNKYAIESSYEFVHQGSAYEVCNLTKGAVALGMSIYNVKECKVVNVEGGRGVMYAYHVDIVVKGKREARWFYFLVDGKELRNGLKL